MNCFHLTIASPDGNWFDGEVACLSLRGTEGDLAIMAHHVPFITAVRPGTCKLKTEDGKERAGKIEGGLLTVTPEKVTLLSGSFRWKDDENESRSG